MWARAFVVALVLTPTPASFADWGSSAPAGGIPERAFITYLSHVGLGECYVDMAVVLGETLKSYAPEVPRSALVVSSGVAGPAARRLAELWHLLETPDLNVQGEGDFSGHWGKAISKIFMFIVPARIAVYLDVDVLVRSVDILQLFQAPISDTGVGMVPDCCMFGNVFSNGTCCNETRTMNSGVVVFRPSPSKLRRFIDLWTKHRETGGFTSEQNFFPAVFEKDILTLEPKFNFHYHDKNIVRRLRDVEGATVVHFVASPKPACVDPDALRAMKLRRYRPTSCAWCPDGVAAFYAEYYQLLRGSCFASHHLRERLARAEMPPNRSDNLRERWLAPPRRCHTGARQGKPFRVSASDTHRAQENALSNHVR